MEVLKKQAPKEQPSEVGDAVLEALNRFVGKNGFRISDTFVKILVGVIIACILVIGTGTFFFVKTINDMHSTYIHEAEKIIIAKGQIDYANQWEKLPINQRKERLRERFYEIVRYYINDMPVEQRMPDDMILDTFNSIWSCVEKAPHINFFLPVAYMKVKTNFNSGYNNNYQRGIVGFYPKTSERISNLPLARNDPAFRVIYKGLTTLLNPSEAVKLLMTRIEDLMSTFKNREDWVTLSLFIDEYNVIAKYWKNGEGEIPEELYQKGDLANTLMYYQSFKNWQIPSTTK